MRILCIIFLFLFLSASVSARGGRGGGGRGSSGGRGGGGRSSSSSRGSSGHSSGGRFFHSRGGGGGGSGSSSSDAVIYEPDRPFATPNRTEAFKRALVAEVRKAGRGLSGVYFVETRRYSFSFPQLMSAHMTARPVATTAAPPADEDWPSSLRAICGRNVLGDDPILGVLFRRNRKPLTQRNATKLFWVCEIREFCCGFECCPEDAVEYGDGYYTMKDVTNHPNPILIILGFAILIWFFLFILQFWKYRTKKKAEENGETIQRRSLGAVGDYCIDGRCCYGI